VKGKETSPAESMGEMIVDMGFPIFIDLEIHGFGRWLDPCELLD
jgi:hypothetical protein